jgi:hypothetical protein
MKNLRKINLLILIAILLSMISNAQLKSETSYIGPSIGMSFLGSAPQFGFNYEYTMDIKKTLQVEMDGVIGVGGIFRYWSYSDSYFSGSWSYTDILIGAQGNYHFKSSGKFDLWTGLVLAYDIGSVKWDGPSGNNWTEPSYGGLWLGAHAGARYFFSPSLALTGRIGFGTLSYGAIDIGLDFVL